MCKIVKDICLELLGYTIDVIPKLCFPSRHYHSAHASLSSPLPSASSSGMSKCCEGSLIKLQF